MASFGQQRQTAPQARQPWHGLAGPAAGGPPGTFSPGTKIQVGSHRVIIQKYLSEGGFAHVYLVKMPKAVDGTDLGVLKRVAVPDKETLRSMRTEVETMKRLKGHRPIVTYIDSHASEMRGGWYEVFLLMEYCNGGGLIDFMNTRLQHRLTEPEILSIFADIAEGVACMHYLKPPLLHRDLKVENVLITARGASKRFKLCDFGSAAPPRPAPTTVAECRLMDEDVQRHTTLQYRSPEMVDVYRKQPLNEKVDIWALGVLLYKLCYYTTPFEEQGTLAILNASYRYPSHPTFSDGIKKLIASMLREHSDARPTIYQVLKEACAMQGREVPVRDVKLPLLWSVICFEEADDGAIQIYTGKRPTEPNPIDKAPTESKAKPVVGAVVSAPVEDKARIPEVVPMRRGRPSAAPAVTKTSAAPGSPSKPITEGDPFAALDSKNGVGVDGDDFSSRFPSLDQFSLLHDQGAKFNFDSVVTSPPSEAPATTASNPKTTARPASPLRRASPLDPAPSPGKRSIPPVRLEPATAPSLHRPASMAPSTLTPSATLPKSEVGRAQSIISSNPDLKAISHHTNSKYVSTGTMTGEFTPEKLPTQSVQDGGQSRADHDRTSDKTSFLQPYAATRRRPSLSSRPSLEDNRGKVSSEDQGRAGALSSRRRPASTAFETSTLEFLRERESFSKAQRRPARPLSRGSQHRSSSCLNAPGGRNDVVAPSGSAEALIDFGGGNDSDSDPSPVLNVAKRGSAPQASGHGNKLAGKFGDAFARFEGTAAQDAPRQAAPPLLKGAGHRDPTPIAGSEVTGDRSEDELVDATGEDGDDNNTTPEMRRELERRQLEEEEQRVAAAQAEYRKRVAGSGESSNPRPASGPKKTGVVPKSANIQSRVRSLMDEEQRQPRAVQRTAEGYGKYSDAATAASKPEKEKSVPTIPRKPFATAATAAAASAKAATTGGGGGKPAAPKKPTHLNSVPTGVSRAAGSTVVSPTTTTTSLTTMKTTTTTAAAAAAVSGETAQRLMAADLPGQPLIEMSAKEKDDYIRDFTKRFPSLNSMELEAAIRRGDGAVRR